VRASVLARASLVTTPSHYTDSSVFPVDTSMQSRRIPLPAPSSNARMVAFWRGFLFQILLGALGKGGSFCHENYFLR
jgi:hypothetical protein